MADSEARGRQYMDEARKKLTNNKGFFGMFSGGNKTDEAIELFIRAGNMFKMSRKWSEAGKAFCEAADLHWKLGNKHDAATGYCDAGLCFKKTDPNEAVNCYVKAIEIYTDMGKFNIAAKHHESVADIYENELVDIENALTHLQQAAEYYKGEESKSSANKCLLTIARHATQLEKYEKAIEIYEEVAIASCESPLLKYAAKDHFFHAALCHMCVDLLNAQIAIQKYEEMHPAFSGSREYKLLKILLSKLEESDVDGFTEAVEEYDSISKIDSWLTNILLKIKRTINAEPDLR